MPSSSVRAALLALTASASLVAAERGLSLKVSGPEAVDGVDNLKVTTTLTNTGDETLKLLNDPRGPLHTLPANSFAITTDSGDSPSFIGVKAKYVPAQAAKSASDKVFTILEPGQSVAIDHDLSAAYNFTLPGAGKYTVEPSNLFHFVDPETNEPIEIRANVATHVAKVAGKLAVARPSPTLARRYTYKGCSAAQQSSIRSAAAAAQSYVKNALSHLRSHTAASPRYTTWFGAYTGSRHGTVQGHFSKISGNDLASFTYDCACDEESTYAYVYPNDFGHIHFCGAFWQAPTTGTDSKAGTIVHEVRRVADAHARARNRQSSHFTRNGGTDDIVYGQSGAKSLAKSKPDQAVRNADSHEYFAENHPSLS
ncbi:peptidyl-Lys metalloendopeptidase [Trametes elegans]|nr:peptidyl-Lys metalloendopeptidase [Trametes elegans]